MELTLLPGLVTPTPAEPGSTPSPDPANPETAAAFAALLAGLVAPPAPQAAPPTFDDGSVSKLDATPTSATAPPIRESAAAIATGGPQSAETATLAPRFAGIDPATTPEPTPTGGHHPPEAVDKTPRFTEPTPTGGPESTETATLAPRFATTEPTTVRTRGSESTETATLAPRFATTEPTTVRTRGPELTETATVAPRLAGVDSGAMAVLGGMTAAGAMAAAPTPAVDVAPAVAVPTTQAVVDQLVDHLGDQLGELTAQRAGSDHELTVQLDPADLGRVELRIHLADDLVHVHLGAQERSTADLVRQHLPELRAALESAGIATGGLDVGDHPGHRPPTSDDGPELAADLGRRPSPSLVADPRSVTTSSATALDLLL